MNQQDKTQLTVWWVLWATFQVGVFVIYFVLQSGPSRAVSPSPDSGAWIAAGMPVLMSIAVRWNILPRFKTSQSALPFMIIGIAMAESTTFMGLFIFRAHQLDLFILSVLGIFQFVPFYARNYFPPDGSSRDE